MKKTFILFLIIFLLAGCQSAREKGCATCANDKILWKTAVDTITLANFPEEEFVAVVHRADFSNAWVTNGNKVNITANFLHKLMYGAGLLKMFVNDTGTSSCVRS